MRNSDGGNSRHHYRRNVYRKFAEIFEREGRVNRVVRLGDEHVRPATRRAQQAFDSCFDLVGPRVTPHRDHELVVREAFGLGIERPADKQGARRKRLSIESPRTSRAKAPGPYRSAPIGSVS